MTETNELKIRVWRRIQHGLATQIVKVIKLLITSASSLLGRKQVLHLCL